MLWTVAHQGPLSLRFPRQEDWSGLPFPPPGDLPNVEIESMSLMSPALAGRFFITSAAWMLLLEVYIGLPWWLSGKESTCQCRKHGFNPWFGIEPLCHNY